MMVISNVKAQMMNCLIFLWSGTRHICLPFCRPWSLVQASRTVGEVAELISLFRRDRRKSGNRSSIVVVILQVYTFGLLPRILENNRVS